MFFRSPVGTEEERNSGQIWPSKWTDATGFLNSKAPNYGYGIHTGADLNLNLPGNWDADKLAPVYSIGDGVVTYAQLWPNRNYWGNIIVIEHGIVDGKPLFSRYAHVANIRVRPGDVVKTGQQISQVGNGEGLFSYHLHFDISITTILRNQPQNWPAPSSNRNKALVKEHYVDPEQWLRSPHVVNSLPDVIGEGSLSGDSSDDKSTPVNTTPSLPTWHVLAAEVTIYQKPRTSSEKSGTLGRGKQVFIGAEGVRNENMQWGRIVGGTFDGDWVAIRKEEPRESYLSTNPPQD
ncbi:MAG: M23 family metallopeptidase [Anaerolineales bacterium]|nr:M23 family metallopeptidase [Anaerolineales bacterium]